MKFFHESASAEALPLFYDVHMHVMSLSHPAFLAFLRNLRDVSKKPAAWWSLPFEDIRPMLDGVIRKHLLMNLLAVMEHDIGSVFCLIEDDLAGQFRTDGQPGFLQNGVLEIAGTRYGGLVLCPLIMDFGDKSFSTTRLYYNRPIERSIRRHARDVLNGIRDYRHRRPQGALQIYPFLGVNTALHTMQSLEKLLHEFFRLHDFSRKFFHQTFSALSQLKVTDPISGKGLFAGIKLYPPLGFDPWPDSFPEREKVRYLYQFCCDKNLPITTHCDDLGFRTVTPEEVMRQTAPDRWEPVLKEFPDLKLNFAHMGRQYHRTHVWKENRAWFDKIIGFCLQYPNVYSDFSFTGCRPEFYDFLASYLHDQSAGVRKRLSEKILFGSDFSINLLQIQSYYDYYEQFAASSLDTSFKHACGSQNPARFLFE